jgi:hypothetical protein
VDDQRMKYNAHQLVYRPWTPGVLDQHLTDDNLMAGVTSTQLVYSMDPGLMRYQVHYETSDCQDGLAWGGFLAGSSCPSRWTSDEMTVTIRGLLRGFVAARFPRSLQ